MLVQNCMVIQADTSQPQVQWDSISWTQQDKLSIYPSDVTLSAADPVVQQVCLPTTMIITILHHPIQHSCVCECMWTYQYVCLCKCVFECVSMWVLVCVRVCQCEFVLLILRNRWTHRTSYTWTLWSAVWYGLLSCRRHRCYSWVVFDIYRFLINITQEHVLLYWSI